MSISDDSRRQPSEEETERTTDMERTEDVEDARSADMGSESMDSAFDELDGDGVNPPEDGGEVDGGR
jgi:hypothetical protein